MSSQEADIQISLIVAMSQNHVIGRDGGLPWQLSDDLKWFKSVTMSKPILMGRKTFDSIGKPLPGRPNLVVTRDVKLEIDGVEIFQNIPTAIQAAKLHAQQLQVSEICVIGGGVIYQETLPLADTLYITEVLADVEGDTTFPSIDKSQWTEECVGTITQDAKNNYDARLMILRKRLCRDSE